VNEPDEWTWEHRSGPAGTLHEPSPPNLPTRTVRQMRVEAAAIVLGSSQDEADIDHSEAERRGIEVARRRSGGGAVLLVPGDHVWLDVWLPAGDPLWDDDVGRAADWLASVWISALDAVGVRSLAAHRGALITTEWSRHVCFAGLGPGEVTARGRKLVGISQRRTRDWARFQCLVHRRWDADVSFGLLAMPGAVEACVDWADRVATVGDSPIENAMALALAEATATA
jgi:lipoate---protein ligase